MTVQELITRFEELDPQLRIVVRGFDETGFDDLETVKPTKVKFNDGKNRRGRHQGQHSTLSTESEQGSLAVFVGR